MEEREAQRLNGREARQRCVLSGAATPLSTGIDLEVRQKIMCEGDELLPSTVGGVRQGGHGVEGEPTLQLRDRLLVRAAAGHEVPEVRERVIEIAGDGRVLVGTVVRVEQIQLEVLRGLMRDLASIDRHRKCLPHGVSTAGTMKPDTSALTRVQARAFRMNCCRSSQ